MADYININGNNIPIRASDPSNPILGEVWYNLTTNALKGQGAFTATVLLGLRMLRHYCHSGFSGAGGAGTSNSFGLAWWRR
jgi:hypothetical protein